MIEKLQGFEAAASTFEEEILGSRIAEYGGGLLDRLGSTGEVVWGRFSARQNTGNGTATGQYNGRAAFSRFTPLSLALRESLDWLLPGEAPQVSDEAGAQQEALEYLSRRGASFISDIVTATKRMPSDVEEALWTLAAAGMATTDGLEALRQRLRRTGKPRRVQKAVKGNLHRRRGISRWWLLEPEDPPEDRTEAMARQLLHRYGVLFPELLARESLPIRWRDAARVLRRLEARGEIRGGRFVSGFVGEQFALAEAADSLRRWRNRDPDDRLIIVSACDPLNLAGILTPGPRVPSVPGQPAGLSERRPPGSHGRQRIRALVRRPCRRHGKSKGAIVGAHPTRQFQAGSGITGNGMMAFGPHCFPRLWDRFRASRFENNRPLC